MKPKEETIGQQFGRLGGVATRDKYGNDHFKRLSERRWSKKKDAFKPKDGSNSEK